MIKNKSSDKPTDTKPPSPDFTVFLSLGLRPFFLSAAVFAILAIGFWALALQGYETISPSQGMVLWHMHELVFGYGSAVLTGFLLTAVPNWTGRKPLSGLGLGALWGLWMAGRLSMMVETLPILSIALDLLFLPLVIVVVGRDVMAAKNWRNLMVLVPIGVIALSNSLFHYEVVTEGAPQFGIRLGLSGLVFLVMLIGGRIIPAFTANWLKQQGMKSLPVVFNRVDASILLVSVVVLGCWVFIPVSRLTGVALAGVGVLHLFRLTRWCGLATWSNPLLLVLHSAYLMIPVGLGFAALSILLDDAATGVAAMHLFGIGVVGCMTMAVMSRASLGHTGQALWADGWMQAGFAMIFLAAFARALAEYIDAYDALLLGSALFWIVGFGLFTSRVGFGLLGPRPGRH